MFDEFLDELRRRQAEAAGRPSPRRERYRKTSRSPTRISDPDEAVRPEARPTRADEAESEPIPIDPAGPRAGTRRARRAAAGRHANPAGVRSAVRTTVAAHASAASSPWRSALIAVLFIFIMLAVGLELWTDAIWFRSVGYDAVFWTRLGVQLRLFAVGLVVALLLLLGNLWLAGRLAPPAGRGRRERLGPRLDRPPERGRHGSEQRSRRAASDVGGDPAAGPAGRSTSRRLRHPRRDADRPRRDRRRGGLRRPDGRRCARVELGDGAALDEPGPVRPGRRAAPSRTRSSAGTSRSSSSSSAFLRFVQVTLIGLVIASLVVAGARYLVAALDGSAGLQHARPRPSRGARRARPHGDRVRLPARQVRARLQQPRHRNRRRLHGRERPVPRLRRPDRPLGDRRGVPRRRGVLACPLAARADGRGLADRIDRDRADLPGGRSSASRSSRTSSPRSSRTSRTTSR